MRVTYAHLCDYALLSVEGKLGMLGVFSRIAVQQLPALHPQAYLVFELALDYTEIGHPFDVRVECVDADGTLVIGARTQIQTQGIGRPGDRPLVPQILRLPPIQFTRAGAYDINIFLGTDPASAGRVSFEIVQLAPPPAPPIQGQPMPPQLPGPGN
jgi:hypothetical protein